MLGQGSAIKGRGGQAWLYRVTPNLTQTQTFSGARTRWDNLSHSHCQLPGRKDVGSFRHLALDLCHSFPALLLGHNHLRFHVRVFWPSFPPLLTLFHQGCLSLHMSKWLSQLCVSQNARPRTVQHLGFPVREGGTLGDRVPETPLWSLGSDIHTIKALMRLACLPSLHS
jgi:hypothetical protein